MSALGIFTRAPRPGATKTRLEPAVGAGGAAELHRAFLEDTLTRFAPAISVTLFAARDDAWLRDLAERHGVHYRVQCEGDLGVRMRDALARLLRSSARAFLIGSDAPTLPLRLVRAAQRAEGTVFAPSSDGGYVLVGGASAPQLAPVRWSTRHALADSLALNPTSQLLEPWYDVDLPEDLALLRAHLDLDAAAAPHTAAWLRRHFPQEGSAGD